MNTTDYARQDDAAQYKVRESFKKHMIERAITFAILWLFLIVPTTAMFFIGKETAKVYTEAVENLNGFHETEESIIRELYGDRNGYADKMTFHTDVNFVDKEASAREGAIVYDEEAKAAYYNSFLEEYDAMIDHEKVNSILEERKAAYIETHKTATEIVQKEYNIKWLELAFISTVVIILCYLPLCRKYAHIRDLDYDVVEAKVVKKFSRTVRSWGRHRFKIRYDGGEAEAYIPGIQAYGISEGDTVYFADIHIRTILKTGNKWICKK